MPNDVQATERVASELQSSSLDALVGRAFVTQGFEERKRWVLVVTEPDEDTATEYRCSKTAAEGAVHEATLLRDAIQKRGRAATVAVGEVVERMRIVEELHASTPNKKLTDSPGETVD